jgi:hypothetical protein
MEAVRRPQVIYVLRCPHTDGIRYVGQTWQPRNRRNNHTRQICPAPKTRVQVWTSAMVAAGTPPIFEIVAVIKSNRTYSDDSFVCDSTFAARALESRIIRRCLDIGCDLLNRHPVIKQPSPRTSAG